MSCTTRIKSSAKKRLNLYGEKTLTKKYMSNCVSPRFFLPSESKNFSQKFFYPHSFFSLISSQHCARIDCIEYNNIL